MNKITSPKEFHYLFTVRLSRVQTVRERIAARKNGCWTDFFFKKLEDISAFCGATDTSVLDFW